MNDVNANSRIRRQRGVVACALIAFALLLAACGQRPPSTPDPEPDTSAPGVTITSPDSVSSAAYTLTGTVEDDVGVTNVVFSLEGGDLQEVVRAGNEFSAGLTLQQGLNHIDVYAGDAAGNVGKGSITVLYEPLLMPVLSIDIAQRGESLTLTGEYFGAESGGVEIGGVPAVIDSWTDTLITLTVPGNAPDGPGLLALATTHGASATLDFFVGVGAPAGSLEDLAALGAPPGTAVRLAAGTYAATGAGLVVLDNLSLYGQGEDATLLDAGGTGLELLADEDRNLVVAGLSINLAGSANIEIGPAAGTIIPVAAGTSLSPQNNPQGTFTIENVTVTGASSGFFQTLNALGSYIGDLVLRNVLIDTPHLNIRFETLGSVVLDTVNVLAEEMLVYQHYGRVTTSDVFVEASWTIILHAQYGLDIADSRFRSDQGWVVVVHEQVDVPAEGSDSVIRNSIFEANAEFDEGDVSVIVGPATQLTLEDSVLQASGRVFLSTYSDVAAIIAGNVVAGKSVQVAFYTHAIATVTGNTFGAPAGFATLTPTEELLLGALSGSEITFADNEFHAGLTGFWLGNGSTTHFADNGFQADLIGLGYDFIADENDAADLMGANVTAHFIGNTFDASERLQVIFGEGGSLEFDDNDITAADVYTNFLSGSLVMTGNRFDLQTPGEPDPWFDIYSGGGEGEATVIFSGNTVKLQGASHLRFTSGGSLEIHDNVVSGTGAGTALALAQATWLQAVELTATGNTFTGFENALWFNLAGSEAQPYDATINHNVFDFPITEAPQAAYVAHAHNASLDARHNVWHNHTSASTVEPLVAYHNSGKLLKLLLDPVSQP